LHGNKHPLKRMPKHSFLVLYEILRHKRNHSTDALKPVE
jgi:hypothetical protein